MYPNPLHPPCKAAGPGRQRVRRAILFRLARLLWWTLAWCESRVVWLFDDPLRA
jgi:hypothetical protein